MPRPKSANVRKGAKLNQSKLENIQQRILVDASASTSGIDDNVASCSGLHINPSLFYGKRRTASTYIEEEAPFPEEEPIPEEASFLGFDSDDGQPLHSGGDIQRLVHQDIRSHDENKLELRQKLFRSTAEFRDLSKRPAERYGEGIGLFNVSGVRSAFDACHSSCKDCGNELKLDFKTHDLDTGIVIRCEGCDELKYDQEITTRYNSQLSEATAGLVNLAVNTGGGFADCNKFTSSMNLNKQLSNRRYIAYKNELHNQTEVMMSKYRPAINECVLSQYKELDIEPEEDGLLNVDVSYDGSWLTRGHVSNIGAGFVMDADTAFVLDCEVLSKYCQICTRIKDRLKDDDDTCREEIENHKRSGKCTQNYEGPSGGMEKQMALNMWRRSADINAMRYTTLVSDGDSSSFNALQEDNVYDGYAVVKEECVNHVAKRMGTRLRKLKKECTNEKVSKSGKKYRSSILGGKGKLTDNVINSLSSYYGKAIRDNQDKDVESMRKACLSGFKHVTSTNEQPDHDYCPQGSDSYCFYNKAIANRETPADHNKMKVKMDLGQDEKDLVRNVYESLTSDDLLKKCLKGRTQNPNESIHSKLWNKLRKTKSYGLKTVQHAVAQTANEHNVGYANSNVLKTIGFSHSTVQRESLDMSKDKIRQAHSLKKDKKKKVYRQNPDSDEDYIAGGF